MSIFDKERQRLGLPTSGASSFLAEERRRLFNGEKTRYQEIQDRNVDNQRFAGRAMMEDSSAYKPKDKKKSSSNKPKDEPFLTDVKNFFTSKDTNHDGQRDGLLGLADRYLAPISLTASEVLAPGNNEAMIKNEKAKYGKIQNPITKAQQVDRGTETKILHGLGTILGYTAPYGEAYKGVDFALNKLPKLAELVKNPYAMRAIKGGLSGLTAELGLVGENELVNPDANNMKDYGKRIAYGAIGGAIGDPLLHGIGQGIVKGSEKYATNVMGRMLPKNEEVAKGLSDTLKTFQSEHVPIKDFPNINNRPNTAELQDLIPKATDNLHATSNLQPKTDLNPKVPKIGQTVEEMLNQSDSKLKTPQQVETPQNINALEQPSNAVNEPVNVPKTQVPKVDGERKFYSTVGNSEKTTPEMAQKLAEFDKSYKPMSNEELVKFANDYVAKDMEKAYQFVKNAKKFDPRHITVGHRLIDELQKTGQYDRALDVVERLAEQGTKAGQSIQSYSIYNRLSVEGQLLRAQRHVNKINASIPNPEKQIKLTPETVNNIAQTADSIKRFTGQEEQATNVMKIMDSIKQGNRPTDAELKVVQSFVADAKKFVGDLTPDAKPPKIKPVTRNRDKVIDFMNKREEVARERLKQRMNRANSLPVDVFYDLSIIGASKIAKGTVKLADFTEEMVKEFGDMVRPYARQLYDKAVETFNLQSESITRQRLSEVEKITNTALKDKNLDADQAEVIRDFARRVGSMTGDAKLEASMELQATLQALERPTFGQKISAAQTIAQLLNPKTIARNAIGNEVFYRTEKMIKLLTTPIDIAKSKITGSNRVITFVTHNQGQYWKNWMTGAKAGWKGVNPMGLTTAYDLGPQAFRGKYNPMTYFEKALGATLRSFDYAGYMRVYNETIGELSTLRAINEGLTGQAKKQAIKQYIREADENIQHIADEYGKYATFQDNTVFSNALTKGKRGLNKASTYVATLGLAPTKDFGLGDLIIKYPKTPGNLIMRALEYSPAGFIRSASILKSLKSVKSLQNEREFYLSLSRAIMGTGGFSLLGYVLADKGILTSAGNSDYEVASLEKSTGKQANSVNLSALKRFIDSGFNLNKTGTKEGDTFVSYDWAQPLSIAIALGTGVEQSTKENDKLGVVSGMKGAFDSASNTIVNQSVLKGVSNLISDYKFGGLSGAIEGAVTGSASSFVPTLSNQAKQLNDNTTRNTYSPDFLTEIKNKAYSRVPSLERSLPPSYDTLGNKKQTFQNGSNSLFNVLLNPSFVSQYKPSKEAKFVLDYINATGDKKAPHLADKNLDGTPLTGAQQSKWQNIMGDEVKRQLNKAIPNLDPKNYGEISKALENILRKATIKSKSEMRKELLTKKQLDEAWVKHGLDESTVYDRIKNGWTITKALNTPNE